MKHFLRHFQAVEDLTQAEDGSEECVANLQGEGEHPRLVVVLDPHGHHVEEDEYKDGNLESANHRGCYRFITTLIISLGIFTV